MLNASDVTKWGIMLHIDRNLRHNIPDLPQQRQRFLVGVLRGHRELVSLVVLQVMERMIAPTRHRRSSSPSAAPDSTTTALALEPELKSAFTFPIMLGNDERETQYSGFAPATTTFFSRVLRGHRELVSLVVLQVMERMIAPTRHRRSSSPSAAPDSTTTALALEPELKSAFTFPIMLGNDEREVATTDCHRTENDNSTRLVQETPNFSELFSTMSTTNNCALNNYSSDWIQEKENTEELPSTSVANKSTHCDDACNGNNVLVHDQLPVTIEGRRVVDFNYFFQSIKEIINHGRVFGCSVNNINIIRESRIGFVSTFHLKCDMCNAYMNLHSSEGYSINDDAVMGIMSIGNGYKHLKQLSSCLEIPCMSGTKYNEVHNRICEVWEDTAFQSMREAAEEEKIFLGSHYRLSSYGK
ncbi:hypothetical protein FQR65_LT15022 [Abscondita terminalis]|nr:hypothetical protein FQR65_LT15022 [Abscondita terminalis]